MNSVLRNEEVLRILESILGKGIPDKNTGVDYTFYCPICKWHKPKLVINIESGIFNCWTCRSSNGTKGPNVLKLIKKLEVSKSDFAILKQLFKNKYSKAHNKKSDIVVLPDEFIPLSQVKENDLEYNLALNYAKKRKLSYEDIVKYNIGYCESGRYRRRLIVPSYDASGNLNYFIARSYEMRPGLKIDTPSVEKSNIIGFEYYINWEVPIILCEGIFDAMAIKRNAIPLFGNSIGHALKKKIVQSKVKTVYLALDKDAILNTLDHVEELMNHGKDVYMISLPEKDPSEIGFSKMVDLLKSATQLNFRTFFLEKLKNV